MGHRVRARGLQEVVGRVPSRGDIANFCNQALAGLPVRYTRKALMRVTSYCLASSSRASSELAAVLEVVWEASCRVQGFDVSNSNSAPSLRLPGLLPCPEGSRPLAAAPECSGASRQTPAFVEYLRRHAGLGQDSNPAKQSRIQLHVARTPRG